MSEGHFEAKVSAKRETGAGIFLTLQIQPDDYQSDLATLRVGSALMIGWAEVVNPNVEPIELAQGRSIEPTPPPNGKRQTLDSAPSKERKPFSSLPLSQQAALRSQDLDFMRFLLEMPKGSLTITVKADKEIAPEFVRKLCGVDSRSQIIAGTKAGDAWLDLESKYQAWKVDRQYAYAVRR